MTRPQPIDCILRDPDFDIVRGEFLHHPLAAPGFSTGCFSLSALGHLHNPGRSRHRSGMEPYQIWGHVLSSSRSKDIRISQLHPPARDLTVGPWSGSASLVGARRSGAQCTEDTCKQDATQRRAFSPLRFMARRAVIVSTRLLYGQRLYTLDAEGRQWQPALLCAGAGSRQAALSRRGHLGILEGRGLYRNRDRSSLLCDMCVISCAFSAVVFRGGFRLSLVWLHVGGLSPNRCALKWLWIIREPFPTETFVHSGIMSFRVRVPSSGASR